MALQTANQFQLGRDFSRLGTGFQQGQQIAGQFELSQQRRDAAQRATDVSGRATTEFDQGQSQIRSQVLGKLATTLKTIPLERRDAFVENQAQELAKFNIDASVFRGEPKDDASLDQVIAASQAFTPTAAAPSALDVARTEKIQAETAQVGKDGVGGKFQKGATALIETDQGPAFATQVLDPKTGTTRTEISQISGELISKLGETGQEQTLRKIEEAGGRAGAKGIAARNQEIITSGIAAADSTAGIRRGMQLLEEIETGGFDKVNIAAKQFFGVESGDEGELSNLLGKAVLSQLRATFGAAFTAKEGESLKGIEANMGRSPASNRRLLKNALNIAERTAKRAINRAIDAEDFQTAADIQDSLDFVLGDLPEATADLTQLSDEDLSSQLEAARAGEGSQ